MSCIEKGVVIVSCENEKYGVMNEYEQGELSDIKYSMIFKFVSCRQLFAFIRFAISYVKRLNHYMINLNY